ncbi:DNA damage-inducible protein 1 [Entomophthora muscae]|uniref:DNA damage-inducible protein 1 n=1 Tax=Entomophthora muscae TaxID=34485 RepID=A0ACC2TY20_9FUNG|nr:DNA damage-inducible protein 1 [Entomophthora muscae]
MFGPPNVRNKPLPAANFPGRSDVAPSTNKFVPKTDITKVVCHCYNWKGHYTSNYWHSRAVSLIIRLAGKSQCGVEEELSTSTQPINVPPDLRFTPNTGFSGNALHQVLVDDVHMVQTQSKVQASQEATKESPSIKMMPPPLRGVNMDIPMETMKDCHPELYYSIVKLLSINDNLDIHLVNKIGSSYSECTYADIFVNKLKVWTIIDTGAPINIVSSKLVQQMGLAHDINHRKQYGTARLDCTTEQGAYSALPLRFGSLAVSAPAIVLPNENYDILIGTLFMQQYGVKTDLENDVLEILGNSVEEYKGLSLHTNSSIIIPVGHQVLMDIGLDLQIPQGLYGKIETPRVCSRLEPLVALVLYSPIMGP